MIRRRGLILPHGTGSESMAATTKGSGRRGARSASGAPRRRRASKGAAEPAAALDREEGGRAAPHGEDGEPEGEREGEEVIDGEVGDDTEVVDDTELDDEPDAALVDAELERLSGGPAPELDTDERHRLVKRDPLTAYIQETRRYPLLDRDEEHALAVRLVEEGDTTAARRLVEANLRLVVKIAYEYRRAHRNLLDLIQESNMGLMQAGRQYDPYRGVKLSSYAAWWIRAYILKFILNNWRLVKIGTTQAQRKLFFNLKKEREKLEQLGFHPEPALLAERLDVREKDVIEMEKRLAAPE